MQKRKGLLAKKVEFPTGIDVASKVIAVAAAASTPDS